MDAPLARRSRIAFAGLILAALLATPRSTGAWSVGGHMVTAAIAHRELLARDPRALQRVLQLLRSHPAYAEWTEQIRKQAARPGARFDPDAALFMLAARWPDDVRRTRDDHPSWHFVNHPYAVGGTPPRPAAHPNLEDAFEANRRIVRDANRSAGERAIALSWILHLVGDAHQPLHAVAMYAPGYETGDRGGNRVLVRTAEGRRPTNLHTLWDGFVLQRGTDLTEADRRAIELRGRPEFARSRLRELAEKKLSRWTGKESRDAAVRTAYRNGALRGSPDPDSAGAPVLPTGYTGESQALGERRAMLAGLRMADLLGAWF